MKNKNIHRQLEMKMVKKKNKKNINREFVK